MTPDIGERKEMSREIDVQIAEKIMGSILTRSAFSEHIFEDCPGRSATFKGAQLVPYSTNIVWAMDVVKKMGQMIFETNEIEMRYVPFNGEWHVDTVYDGRNIYAGASTLPMAICTAAFMMVDINYKPKE